MQRVVIKIEVLIARLNARSGQTILNEKYEPIEVL